MGIWATSLRRVYPGVAAWTALLGFAGVGLVANALWIPAKAEFAQVLIDRSWERARAGETHPRPWPWADTWPVARLRVPRLRQDLFVLAGASGESLAFGPAHVSASALPGRSDNIVIAGHRDTHFRFLRELEVGDEVIVESLSGQGRYRVDATEVVHESRTDLVLPTGQAELTLITCFPFDSIVPGGPLRYVVFARRVE